MTRKITGVVLAVVLAVFGGGCSKEAFVALDGDGTRLSPGVQIDGVWLDSRTAAERGLRISERTASDGTRQVVVENRGESTVRPEEIGWRRVGADGLSLPDVKVWLGGWQMASPCGVRTSEDEDFVFNPGYLNKVINEPRDYVPGEKGRFRAENVVVFRRPDGGMRLFGFITGRERYGHFRVKLGRRGLETLDALCSCDRADLVPGAEIASERLLVADGDDTERLFAAYADRWAEASGARRRFDPPVGWCSYYYYFSAVTLADMIANADWFKAHRDGVYGKVKVMQLDAGFQVASGDWLDWNEKFPGGIEAYARAMKERGFTAGLWIAPFFVSNKSRLMKDHPEWVLRHADGSIAWEMKSDKQSIAVLDGTHPEALAWLEDLFRRIRAAGIDYVKLDFCSLASCVHDARFHDGTATRAMALRRAFEAIRRGFGEDGFILACTTPFSPVVGIADAMRTATDIAPRWTMGETWSECLTVLNVCRNVIQRNYMNGRLWTNDPDTLIVREDKMQLNEEEVRLWAEAVSSVGGSLMLSDNFNTLSERRQPLVRACLERINREHAFPADRWERTCPAVWRTERGDSVFNFTEEAARIDGTEVPAHAVRRREISQQEHEGGF